VAAAAVIAITIPAGLGAFGHLPRPARPQQTPAGPTLYIYDIGFRGQGGTVTPVSTATNTPGKPIRVGGFGQMAVTPDGKTVYVTTGPTVTPISTATNTAGKPIHVSGGDTGGIAITPDGKTAYVTTDTGTVTPIKTATNTPGTPIHVGGGPGSGGQIVITPDGKTAYVTTATGVTPISTATNIPGTPIHVPGAGNLGGSIGKIVITPDGKTAYVLDTGGTVTPINTATNTPGTPIHTWCPATQSRSGCQTIMVSAGYIAVTPDGKTVYVATETGCQVAGYRDCKVWVAAISTATNKFLGFVPPGLSPPGINVPVGASNNLGQIAITPDGKTAYITTGSTVTPINTATNTLGKPIHVGPGRIPTTPGLRGGDSSYIAITPDGKTAYVATGAGVTPINTATNTPGKPIHVSGAPWAVTAIAP
jgi:DNA-binding beta-propeller fold protein YncE